MHRVAWWSLLGVACAAEPPPTPRDTGPAQPVEDSGRPEEQPVEFLLGPEPLAFRRFALEPFEWVRIEGGSFEMGGEMGRGDADELPRHTVTVPTFWITRTEVPAGVYAHCVELGLCDPPLTSGRCMGEPGYDPERPANCFGWDSALAVCEFLGGRLPSESEWEYAARSGGQDREYPWGDDDSRLCELAVLDDELTGCHENQGPLASCSLPEGNTEQGLCDMAGNVHEWVMDWYKNVYDAHPTDGSPQLEEGTFRVLRGGGVGSAILPRTRERVYHEPDFAYPGLGVRCVRGGAP